MISCCLEIRSPLKLGKKLEPQELLSAETYETNIYSSIP